VVLDQGTEISGALGAAVAVQRVVVERGHFFVCDKSHKRQRGVLLLCGARPPGRGGLYELTSPCRRRFFVVDFLLGRAGLGEPAKGALVRGAFVRVFVERKAGYCLYPGLWLCDWISVESRASLSLGLPEKKPCFPLG
jgi:hypothetical protein